MNLVIPMAGRGSRFANQGVQTPKPLIDVGGRPMLAWALDGIRDLVSTASRVIFVALEEHDAAFNLRPLVASLAGERAELVLIEQVTDGQLCTVMAAADRMNADEDLLIASCDTWVASPLARDIADRRPDCHGIISVANLPGDRWSFARTDESGAVVQVAEKERISDHASTGLYYFSSARELIDTANEMIAREEKTRGEYYVIPVYQKYIDRGRRVDISIATEMRDMGTPEAMQAFVTAARA